MTIVDVRIHRADEERARRALGVLGVPVVQIDRDPPRAYLEDGLTKAPEIQLSISGLAEESVVTALRIAGLSVYASRTTALPPDQGTGNTPPTASKRA